MDINKILSEHEKWLNDKADGERANLSGANLRGAIGNSREIKTLSFDRWVVTYTKTEMAMGCQQHTIEQWFSFSDSEINEMDSCALAWWKKYRDAIKPLVELSLDEGDL